MNIPLPSCHENKMYTIFNIESLLKLMPVIERDKNSSCGLLNYNFHLPSYAHDDNDVNTLMI